MRQDYLVEFAGNLFECADSGFARDELVDVVIRPEDLALMPPDQAKLKGVVRSVNFWGTLRDDCGRRRRHRVAGALYPHGTGGDHGGIGP